jgi:hypothetical protein
MDFFRGQHRTFESGSGASTTAILGLPKAGVTGTDYVVGKDVVTVLTFTDILVGDGSVFDGTPRAVGTLLYTFPAGTHVHISTYMDVNMIQTAGDSLDVGIGSVIGSGGTALLSGTATFEDYITGQTVVAAASPGTNKKKCTVATAGALTGISINEAAGTKTVHLNAAGSLTGPGNITATGTVTIKWVKMS